METTLRSALLTLTVTLACVCGPGVALAQDEPTTPGAIPQPWTYQGSMELQRQEQQQAPEPAQPQYQNPAPSYAGPSGGGAAAPAGGRAATPVMARTVPTLRYNYSYACNSEHIVVGHCRSDSDMPGYAPTTPDDDYCQLYYPDRPRHNDMEAMGVVLRSEVMKTLSDCGAFGTAGPGSNRQPTAATSSTRLLSTGPAAGVQHASAGSGPGASAMLTVAAGVSVPPSGYLPAAGANVFVTTRSVDVSLARAGFVAPHGGTSLSAWVAAARTSPDAWRQGVAAMTADPAGVARTDAGGRAQLPPLPPGHYYVFGFVRLARQPLLWNVPIDLKPGSNTLALNQQNATRLQ